MSEQASLRAQLAAYPSNDPIHRIFELLDAGGDPTFDSLHVTGTTTLDGGITASSQVVIADNTHLRTSALRFDGTAVLLTAEEHTRDPAGVLLSHHSIANLDVIAVEYADDPDPHVYAGVIMELQDESGNDLFDFGAYWQIYAHGGDGTGNLFIHGGDLFQGVTFARATSAATFDAAITAPGFIASVKPTVSGSRGGNAAVASLITALAGLGLLTDSSS